MKFDGPDPALAAHRVSAIKLGQALTLLARLFQQTASRDDASLIAGKAGRLTRFASSIDVELTAIEEGSAGVEAVVTHRVPPEDQLTLTGNEFQALATAVRRSLDDVRQEARGREASRYARRFLESLAKAGVTHQSYVARSADGTTLWQGVIDSLEIAPPDLPMPRLIVTVAHVAAAKFATGKEQVEFRTPEDEKIVATATPELLEQALSMRGREIVVRAVEQTGGRVRLLRLDDVGVDVGGDPDERLDQLAQRWSGVLAVLAK